MYKSMIQMIPHKEKRFTILEFGVRNVASTSQIQDELVLLDFVYTLDVHTDSELNRFPLSLNVSPEHLFVKFLPNNKYDVILLPEGIRNPETLRPMIHDKTMIIIRFPKILKRYLEKHFVCSKMNETHWYYGIYRCYLIVK